MKPLTDIVENINSAETIEFDNFAPGMWNEKATKINKESELKKCHPVLNGSKTLSRALKECLSPKYEFGQFSECLTDGNGRISFQIAMLTRILMKLVKVEKVLREEEMSLFHLASLNQADPTISERSKTTQPESTISLKEGMVEKDMRDDLMENNIIAQDPNLAAIIKLMADLQVNEPDRPQLY